MSDRVNQMWRLASRPVGNMGVENFSWHEEPVRKVGEGEMLVRNIYLSLDPASRGWVNQGRSYMPPVQIGEVMRGGAIGIVEESNNPKYGVGDYVQGGIGWQLYGVTDGRGYAKLPPVPGLPLEAHLAVLSHIGFTAYFGLLDIGEPKPGETLVVSAAAGAVGSLVGQIGKIKGCRVVGIAGTDAKCARLVNELGFDAAINYKTESVKGKLKEYCPAGIDIYFENVGGTILDTILTRINVGARIPLCGLISQYNATEPVPGPYNFASLLVNRAKLQGFIVTDYAPRFHEAVPELAGWLMSGQLKYQTDIVEGLENAPFAVNKLFDGSKTGKLMVQVSD